MSAQAKQSDGAGIANQFARDRFMPPVDVISPVGAAESRADLEAAESEMAEDRRSWPCSGSIPTGSCHPSTT